MDYSDLKRRQRLEELDELMQIINSSIDMNHWKLIISYKSADVKYQPRVIFNSAYCRVSFIADYYDRHIKDISIFYGRLHAPDNGGHLIWKGEECRSWHHIFYILPFLDGLSPREAIDRVRKKNNLVDQKTVFAQSEIGRTIKTNDDYREYTLNLHAYLWNYYGQKYFDLFDLHQPELWDKYRLFLSEYKNLINYKPIAGNNLPGIDKVC